MIVASALAGFRIATGFEGEATVAAARAWWGALWADRVERALDQARAVDAIRLGQTTTRPVPTDTRTNSPPAFASDNDLESEVAADILRTCAEVRAAAQNETTASDQEASSEPLTPPLGDSMSWATTFTPTSNHSS